MSNKHYRKTYQEVNLNNIQHNYNVLKQKHSNKTVIAVVKADAYSLGSVEVAKALGEVGVDFFCVATLDEAIELRMHGIKSKILILGIIEPKHINKAIQHRVAVTVPSVEWLKKAHAKVKDKYDKDVWMHINVDTGMNRLGVKDIEDIQEMIKIIHDSDYFVYEGIYTHFNSSDVDHNETMRQYETFTEIVDAVERPQYVHCQNSSASLLYDMDEMTAIRTGLSLYGYYPDFTDEQLVEIKSLYPLKPSMKLYTHVNHVKTIRQNETVSYNQTYQAQQDTIIATLPIGYADGFTRMMQGSYVDSNDGPCEIVGRVTMDHIMIKGNENMHVGDVITLIGENQSLEDVAKVNGTISYEMLTRMSRRLTKRYIKDDQVYEFNQILK